MQRRFRPNLIPWLLSAILVAMLAITTWRMVDLGNRLDEEEDARAAIATELLAAQQQGGAITYRLSRTPDGPETAAGTAFMPESGSGVLSVVNLPTATEGSTWQAWYFRSDSEPPVPGPTFTTSDSGIGYALIPADVGDFRGIGISLEPTGGSPIPSTPMQVQGTAADEARG